MLIGQFCETYPPTLDGVGRVMLSYCQSLDAMGHTALYIAPNNPLYPERLRPVTVRWVRAPIYHQAGRLEVYGTDLELVRETFFNAKSQLVADPGLRKRREFTR